MANDIPAISMQQVVNLVNDTKNRKTRSIELVKATLMTLLNIFGIIFNKYLKEETVSTRMEKSHHQLNLQEAKYHGISIMRSKTGSDSEVLLCIID